MTSEATVRQLDPIKFGTDGWRAVIADQYTFANLERVSQAYASSMLQDFPEAKPVSVSIGYDNRFLSEQFAARVGQVLSANGLHVELFSQAVPTPLLSFAVIHGKKNGGIMITASHNPPEFNGFKIKADWGGSAFEEATRAVEALVDRSPVKMDVAPASDPPDKVWAPYKKHVRKLIDIEKIKDAGLTVVVDSMHGTGSSHIQEFIEGGKTVVKTVRGNRDVLFGGVAPEPVDRNLGALKEAVIAANATVGIATDGDADRLGAVSDSGQTMTMLEVVPILLVHLLKNRGAKGKVVATVTQSVLLRRMARAYNLEFVETPVGFKYIAREMLDSDVLIGAEESGGIGVQGHIPERDGIFNGLLFLEAIAALGKKPSELMSELHKEFGFFAYGRNDLHVSPSDGKQFLSALKKTPPASICGSAIKDIVTMDGVKFVFADDSWLMFRQSGTEPVLRTYAEATSEEKTAQLLSEALVLLKKHQPSGNLSAS